ncbi:hypothetical protein CH379_012985 [Leptospira ellisii]|uniref:Uncharacterized protein n=1 Tax=Leptospira ellisii TaxID=2023197 RepID=A0A2N0B896_9LEPT|nr:hypothetical protein [Leptospira ellisii]MDV6236543.1 hypothetical protein [Leptospira ellisii]PJZ92771.1 hypothetical protein CH379_11390 [Leptospira ellisii]PKA04898.1 hypothetical protein CH375_08300 [Leptospira ellisii]
MRLPDVDRIFDWCVDVLIYWAKVFGITYNEINVYIFCVIWPIVTIGLVVFCVGLWNSNRKLKAKF